VTRSEQTPSFTRTFVTQQHLGKRYKDVTRNEQQLHSDSKSLQINEQQNRFALAAEYQPSGL